MAEGKQQMALIVTTFKNHNLNSLIKQVTAVRVIVFLPDVYPVTMGNNDDSSDSEKYGEDKKDY